MDTLPHLVTKTLRLRVKDRHRAVLRTMARDVNQVWNFCNETSTRAIRERHQFLCGFDLQKLTNGYSRCESRHRPRSQGCGDHLRRRQTSRSLVSGS